MIMVVVMVEILMVHQTLSTMCQKGAPLKCSNCLQLNGAQSNKYSWRCKKPIFDGWARLLSSAHKYSKVLTSTHKLSFICKKHNFYDLAYTRKSFCQGWLESWTAQTEGHITITKPLKPKAHLFNNWVLPVEKDVPFSASCFEKETQPARFRGKFWGKETCQMSEIHLFGTRCQMSEIHFSGTRYSNKWKYHPIHRTFQLNLELCSILILMTFLFSVTKKWLLISITELKM